MDTAAVNPWVDDDQDRGSHIGHSVDLDIGSPPSTPPPPTKTLQTSTSLYILLPRLAGAGLGAIDGIPQRFLVTGCEAYFLRDAVGFIFNRRNAQSRGQTKPSPQIGQ